MLRTPSLFARPSSSFPHRRPLSSFPRKPESRLLHLAIVSLIHFLARPALSRAEDELTDPRIRQIEALRSQASVLSNAGNFKAALRIAERMLTIAKEVYRTDSEPTAQCHAFLADLHFALEDFHSAEAARTEALQILTTLYGEKHWRVTGARLGLVLCQTSSLG